ncbi:fetal and adult testis-expressed transcript protein [Macrotis lagotis]|uniref:fetal and adult testis-expressed transcript protein n=1 Tax=Macrotis lagotis TaxID=92651 RepID=UPI003D691512
MNCTEGISQNLQIRDHPKVAGKMGTEEGGSDNLPLSLYMNVSDNVLFGEHKEVARPLWNYHLRRNYMSSILIPAFHLPNANNSYSFILGNMRPGRMLLQLTEASKTKDQTCDDSPMEGENIGHPEEHFHEGGLGTGSNLEAVDELEITTIKNQLHKISGRLQTLEAQRTGWRQKEFILYSALISACVINIWLWMRR